MLCYAFSKSNLEFTKLTSRYEARSGPRINGLCQFITILTTILCGLGICCCFNKLETPKGPSFDLRTLQLA